MILENNNIRHFFRILIAMLLAYLLYHYVFHKAIGLLFISTLFVMLTSIGSAFYQGLSHFFILMMLVLLGHIFFPHFSHNVHVIIVGSMLGIIINTFIFPDKINLEFKKTVIPFLKASKDYFSAIIHCLRDHHSDQMNKLNQTSIQMESKLLVLPSWVFKPGLDLALQKGYRYYFMKLNHLAEILFAMHYLVRFTYDKTWIAAIEKSLIQCDQSVTEFLTSILKLLELEKLKEGVNDFEENIHDMERMMNKIISVPLELLDANAHIKYLIEFLHHLRELRLVLIQLAKALR